MLLVKADRSLSSVSAETALDLVGVPWRQSSWKTISVSTRTGVARLDELIGPKR